MMTLRCRLTYNDDIINWCDVVVPCGGDGTFLLAASRVRDAKYPPVQNTHEMVDAYNINSRQTASNAKEAPVSPTLATKVLPFLALNEVFIGESVTSRVSLLRLQIDNGAWSHTKSSGLCLVIDGSVSFPFNDGTEAILEIHPEDSLMTVQMDDKRP
ncbi:hypothetical protein HF086_015588 [Spodoptera exigua]|uniref:NAD(+) kinase n=1 Tax=Spodoptera exigua TaxID=7107 RepID=A0A922SEH4_SPOEX|nr:hypothetical protein HF086_015588 [Spodoptera exigua]